MVRKLVLFLSTVCLVLAGATFSHATEIHGHDHATGHMSAERVASIPDDWTDCAEPTCPHHDKHDGDHSHPGEPSAHCGASILGLAPLHVAFHTASSMIHEAVPVAGFVGQFYALDPPPPRLLFS